MTGVDLPVRIRHAPAYQQIRNPARSEYYRNEVAQSHHGRARLSGGGPITNIHVHHLTEIEKRP